MKYIKFLLSLVAVLATIYVFRSLNVKAPAQARVSTDSQAQTVFIHPVWGYKLYLPYSLRDKYEVRENNGVTEFLSSTDGSLLFSISEVGSSSPSGTPIKRGDVLYDFNVGPSHTDLKNLSDFLSSPVPELDTKLKKAISMRAASNTQDYLSISAVEILATEEKATTTEHYLWYAARDFFWRDGRVFDRPLESGPAKLVISKSDGSIISLLYGSSLTSKIKKVFPSRILQSSIYAESIGGHSSLLDKLSSDVQSAVDAYFGREPILNSYGKIKSVSNNLIIFVPDSSLKSGKSITLFISSSTLPLIFEQYIKSATSSATSTITLSSAEWSTLLKGKNEKKFRSQNFIFTYQDGELIKMELLKKE